MSGTQVSSFAPANVLLSTLSGQQTADVQSQNIANQYAPARNQLLLDQGQQGLATNEMDMIGRAAQGVLSLPADQRPAAYTAAVSNLQRYGFAKNAPAQYPGDAALQGFANQSIPVADQYKLGLVTPPGTQAAIDAALGRAPTAPGSAPPAAAPGTGVTIGQRQNNPGNLTFAGQPGASPGQGNRFASFPDMPTGVAANADQLARYQTEHGVNTVRGAVTRWVGDPKADLTSYTGDISKALGVGPDDKIDLTDPNVQAKFILAQFPHESAGGGYVLNPADVQKGVQMAAANRGQVVQAPGTAIATAPAPVARGVAARTGGTDVAGPGAGPPAASTAAPAATTDLVGPRPLPSTGPGSPVVTPASLANTPVAVAAVPQPPPNALAPPAPQPASAQPQSNLPHASEVPTGVNSAQYQQAMELQRKALALDAIKDPTGRAPVMAAALRAQAALAMQADSVVQTQEGQVHTLTGAIDKTAAPLPHYVYDPAQHAYIDTTGTNKPEFEPAQRDSAVAQRDVMELGPKVANGTASPDEVARYNVAATTYQQPTLRENPVTKETVRVNTRELPPGFPQPSGSSGTAGGASGTSGAGGGGGGGAGSQVVMPGLGTAQQEIERNPAAYKVAESQYDRDSKEIAAIGDAGRQSQADQVRVKEMQDVLQKFNSGRGAEASTAAAAWFNSWAPAALTGWQKEAANLSGSSAAEAFSKLALQSAGSQERSVLGNRGGYQAIRLFKEANPNISLQDATNKSILDMQLISNQANADYSQAALSHFADNEKSFAQSHQYNSLAQFDRDWNAQRNPQVYAAAMGAIAGQQPDQWAKGLSDDEYARALQIVQRAKPSAVVNTKSGRYSMEPNAVTTGAPSNPNDKVIRFDHSGNRVQ